ncbi:MAG: DUF3806 domain-containing protein [Deltaproteobacteria bacterium]|nr:DUF3806 domain-containing protein [Deltaproteobacteria bacterium]
MSSSSGSKSLLRVSILGRATVEIPDSFTVEMDDDDQFVRFIPPDDRGAVLEAAVVVMPQADNPLTPPTCAQVVRTQARALGIELESFGDHQVMHRWSSRVEGDIAWRVDEWAIGGAETILMFLATTADQDDPPPSSRALLQAIPHALASLQFTEGAAKGKARQVAPTKPKRNRPRRNLECDILGPEEERWLEEALSTAGALAQRYLGVEPSSALEPAQLDEIADRWSDDSSADRAEVESLVKALGAALGEHLVQRLGMMWGVGRDAEGTVLVVIHPKGMNTHPVEAARERVEESCTGMLGLIAAMMEQRVQDADEQP